MEEPTLLVVGAEDSGKTGVVRNLLAYCQSPLWCRAQGSYRYEVYDAELEGSIVQPLEWIALLLRHEGLPTTMKIVDAPRADIDGLPEVLEEGVLHKTEADNESQRLRVSVVIIVTKCKDKDTTDMGELSALTNVVRQSGIPYVVAIANKTNEIDDKVLQFRDTVETICATRDIYILEDWTKSMLKNEGSTKTSSKQLVQKAVRNVQVTNLLVERIVDKIADDLEERVTLEELQLEEEWVDLDRELEGLTPPSSH